MGRQILPLTVERLPLIVEPCSSCVFWERSPAQSRRPATDPARLKHDWVRTVLQEWGSPGRVGLVDRMPAGYVTYAPAHLVPRAMAFPTAPVSEDAIALVTARIAADFAGQGLGRVLVQRAANDALRHGARALEVFAEGRSGGDPRADPRGCPREEGHVGTGVPPAQHCLLPVDFLTAVGFHPVREHPRFPRMRLELRTALRWREEFGLAVERLFTPVRSLGGRRPVGTVN